MVVWFEIGFILFFFFFNDTATTEIYTLSLHDALPISANRTNPNQHEGYIPGGNLCQESWSNVKPGEEAHVCNLTSLNLANIDESELGDEIGRAHV